MKPFTSITISRKGKKYLENSSLVLPCRAKAEELRTLSRVFSGLSLMVRGVEIWVRICLIGASFLCYLDVLRFVNFQPWDGKQAVRK